MKPPRPNVPALIKRHRVFVIPFGGAWSAEATINGKLFTCWRAPSKRKAVLAVLEQAGVPLEESGCPYCHSPQNPPDANGLISYSCGRHAIVTWERPEECVRRQSKRASPPAD
jgi:hypothetical protein